MSRRSRTRREVLGKHFSRFQAANPGRLHFAAHSHHPWPDATEDAHARYWSDSAALADRKWEKKVFGEVVPKAQAHVARLLRLPDRKSTRLNSSHVAISYA